MYDNIVSIIKIFLSLFHVYVCLRIRKYTTCTPGVKEARRGRQSLWNRSYSQLRAAMCFLGTECGSSASTASLQPQQKCSFIQKGILVPLNLLTDNNPKLGKIIMFSNNESIVLINFGKKGLVFGELS